MLLSKPNPGRNPNPMPRAKQNSVKAKPKLPKSPAPKARKSKSSKHAWSPAHRKAFQKAIQARKAAKVSPLPKRGKTWEPAFGGTPLTTTPRAKEKAPKAKAGSWTPERLARFRATLAAKRVSKGGSPWVETGSMSVGSLPPRAALLNKARDLTLSDRNKAYGDPAHNLTVARELKDVFWGARLKALNDPVTFRAEQRAHSEAIDLILTKLSRIACSPSTEPQEDTYADIAAYAAIAWEVAPKASV